MGYGGRIFADRREAGRRLADALSRFHDGDTIVLALPRGGVPVAYEVAAALAAPLDVLFVRKIGVPGQEELALGAVVDGAHPQLVLNEQIVRIAAPPPGYVEREERRQLDEIERRRRLYRGDMAPVDITDKTVIVVDDGIATGATVKAALQGIGRSGPRRLVLAVPVAPAETLEELKALCDEIVCLATPEPFYAVGLHYRDFEQTSDEEVIRLLGGGRAS